MPHLINAQYNNDLLKQQANDLHNRLLTLDSHVDTPMQFMDDTSIDLGKNEARLKVDFFKMKEGGLASAFFVVYLEQGARDEAGLIMANRKAIRIFESIYAHVEKYPDLAEIITTPEQAYQTKLKGKRAIFIGIENGYCIGKDLNELVRFVQMGARYLTLSHTKNNDICDSSTDRPEHNGLSEFGKQLIPEMNRLGVMIDVSHTSDKTVRDVIKISKAPVVASHSCARALANNPRNLSDDLIKLIARNGGVVQVCLVSRFLRDPDKGKANVVDVVNHIDHIVKLVGVDYVGIGSDFDGGGGNIDGCGNVSQIRNITIELLKRGYNDKDIEKIWGANFLRVMATVQNLAK